MSAGPARPPAASDGSRPEAPEASSSAAPAHVPDEWDAFPVFPPSRRPPGAEAGGEPAQGASPEPVEAPRPQARGIALNIARMAPTRAEDRHAPFGRHARSRNVLRRLAILAVPTTIAAAVSLFVITGPRSEALWSMEPERSPAPDRPDAAAAAPAPSPQPPVAEAVRLAALESRRTELDRRVSGLADAERQKNRTLAELEGRRADLARSVDALAGAEARQRAVLAELTDAEARRRGTLAELEARRAELARTVDGLTEAERQEGEVVAQLTDDEARRRQAVGELETRWADLARVVDDLVDMERQRRLVLAELDARRAGLAREVADLTGAERDARTRLLELAVQQQAEERQILDLERRRETLAAATAELEARQQGLTQALAGLDAELAQAETRAAETAVVEPAAAEMSVPPADEAPAGMVSEVALQADAAEPVQRVFLHYSALEPGAQALADRVARDLTDRGVAVADVRAVRFGIGGNRIRYFFGDEAGTAPAIGAMIAGSLGAAAPEVQDFTHFEPKPSQGTIEVWLTGLSG